VASGSDTSVIFFVAKSSNQSGLGNKCIRKIYEYFFYFLCLFCQCRISCGQMSRRELSLLPHSYSQVVHVASFFTEFVNFDAITVVFIECVT
jgi:hypothetical protein